MNKFKILFVYLVVVGAVVAVCFWLYKSSEQGPGEKPGTVYETQGQEHITEGSIDHPAYNSNPPTSGWHWPQPAAWGVYRAQQPDERLIHNLEHGGIWISYKPDQASQETINLLNDFANRYPLIVVEPRASNETLIALAAWGHLQNLETYDETAILKFIEAYHNKGPEVVM